MTILQQDNHEKIKISISNVDLEREVKSITGWRKNIIERFNKLGSRDYDAIIEKLSRKDY